MKPRFFFILGLPRSRTAWLANWFTGQQSLCLHDPWRFASSAKELRKLLVQNGSGRQYLGAAGSMGRQEFVDLCYEFRAALPDEDNEVSIAYVRRPFTEALESSLKLPLGRDQREIRQAMAINERHFSILPEFVYSLAYDDLESPEHLAQLQEFLTPDVPFDAARFNILHGLKVEVILDKWRAAKM